MNLFASQDPIKHCNLLRYRPYIILSHHSSNSSHSFVSKNCKFPRQFEVTKELLLLYLYHFQLFSLLRITFAMGYSVPCKNILQRKHG